MMLRLILFSIFLSIFFIKKVNPINCYECTSGKGQDCRASASTCSYGLFGCAKITAYSGGVDKYGMFSNNDRSIISEIRACNVLPIGGVDACQQQTLLGMRIVTCYCFNDYCNDANKFVTPIYNELSDKEKFHLFGKNGLKGKPIYDEVIINEFDGKRFDIILEGKEIIFILEDASLMLFDIGLHHNYNNDSKDSLNEHIYYDMCNKVYKGKSINPKGNVISLTGCRNNLRGLIITDDGEMHFIHPVPKRIKDGIHVIHKRSIEEALSPDNHDCIFNKKNDPYPEDQIESDTLISHLRKIKTNPFIERIKRDSVINVNDDTEVIIEIAIFADNLMIKHFYDIYGEEFHMKELKRFVIATVNNVDSLYRHQTLNSKLHFRIKRIDVMEGQPPELQSNRHDNGEVNKLLKSFCEYQQEKKPSNRNDPRYWDHALLFTGFDIYGGAIKNIAGFAPVKGMCSEVRSCTINEGVDFGSVFVVTHEIGHNLGMYHDGQNECHTDCCIMAPSIGSGKTKWSTCSSTEMKIFVNKLGTEPTRPPNCLKTAAAKSKSIGVLPGQDYTVNEQCRLFHGKCWTHGLRAHQTLEDICQMIWCTDGDEKFRTSHPALEGTYCGKDRVCFSGKCVPAKRDLIQVDGGWSKWTENSYCNPIDNGRCNECVMDGQLKLKKEYRYCENPFPNNGGRYCTGENMRGIACDVNSRCLVGKSIQKYIDSVCTEKAKLPKNIEIKMDKKGLHFEHDYCKVWCYIKESTSIRTVDDMPDGTSCGDNKYCLKGVCRLLTCNGTVLGGEANDCSKSGFKKEENKIQIISEWDNWQPWSKCSSKNCTEIGSKIRKRICKGSNCLGANIEKTACKIECSVVENQYSEWSEWLECSTSKCGEEGKQMRTRKCLSKICTGPEIESQSCKVVCIQNIGKLTEWSSWSKCNINIDCKIPSERKRTRDCWSLLAPNPICEGKKEEVELCPRPNCKE
uniref:Peptidase M12B domain-containing protein n=1 Tax=Parastrongyloides trichosuri TaxID=131310 RepID=A0A0N5A6K3_PARTI